MLKLERQNDTGCSKKFREAVSSHISRWVTCVGSDADMDVEDEACSDRPIVKYVNKIVKIIEMKIGQKIVSNHGKLSRRER